MREPTRKQQQVLDYIRDEIESGRPSPCVREIAGHFGFRSTRAACDHLTALEKKNCIRREPGKARSVRLVEEKRADRHSTVDVPVLGRIPAGAPIAAEEQVERRLRIGVEALGFHPSDKTFALVVRGDSMIGRGVFDGDVVVVDGAREPQDGDMVAALIDNECSLKTLVKQQGKTFLKPENPRYENLVPVDELRIQGVARTVIRNLA
ncbi:MAG TPA: repressor LexA [Verrucomicrobia bacterium]|nr:MAG: repressor LexA [Lentisphaerae bacterium GWF2_57_35]HBA83429.1 repressor LexA [Verrucomicrobiota bacterium]